MKKYNPDNVLITITLPDYGTSHFSLTEIYRIQGAAKALLKMALAGEIKGTSSTGICYRLYLLADMTSSTDIIRLVGQIATRWKHTTSPGVYAVYPVPKSFDHDSWWEGEALEYRIDLLRYIIKRLKDTIRRAEKNGKATIQ